MALRKEIANSPAFQSLRQGGDNLARKARIVINSIEDSEISTVVDDPTPVVLFRFDGERWERWSVAWRTYEPAEPTPPLRAFLDTKDAAPEPGDRYRLHEGEWRVLEPGESDPE